MHGKEGKDSFGLKGFSEGGERCKTTQTEAWDLVARKGDESDLKSQDEKRKTMEGVCGS